MYPGLVILSLGNVRTAEGLWSRIEPMKKCTVQQNQEKQKPKADLNSRIKHNIRQEVTRLSWRSLFGIPPSQAHHTARPSHTRRQIGEVVHGLRLAASITTMFTARIHYLPVVYAISTKTAHPCDLISSYQRYRTVRYDLSTTHSLNLKKARPTSRKRLLRHFAS